jgi:hypothetical protein
MASSGVTDIQRAQLARAAGFPENQIAMAVAVSIAEDTSGDPAATHTNSNGSIDTGLWQINSIHGIPVEQLKNPSANAAAAFKIWTDAGNSWKPWSTYPAKAMVFFQRGQFAAKSQAVPNPGGGPTLSVDDNSSLQGIVDFFKFFSDKHNWQRVGMFTFGMILLIIGLFKLTGDNKLSETTKGIAKTAVKMAVIPK